MPAIFVTNRLWCLATHEIRLESDRHPPYHLKLDIQLLRPESEMYHKESNNFVRYMTDLYYISSNIYNHLQVQCIHPYDFCLTYDYL